VAATLTADGELTYFSFPIEKQEETADGDVLVYGKATDGTVDSDLQIVDPDWSAKAIQDWLDSGGNVRVQHQARRDPAGKGVSVEITPDGHYVKALIVEPVAKQLVKKGVLTAYSVGISHPDIRPDPTGKAMNGIITGRRDGHTAISEISLVDRGSNFNSRFQLVKAMGTGIEFVGKMLGEDDEDELSFVGGTYKPSDLAALMAHKAAAARIEKRNVDPNVGGGGVDRDQLKDGDFAGPERSFPIVTPKDVHDASLSLGRTSHDPNAIRRNIISIAHRKGDAFVAQLPDSWKNGGTATKAASLTDAPADPAALAQPVKAAGGDCKTCGGKGKIMEGHRDCPDCGGKPAAEKGTDFQAGSNAKMRRCGQCGTASEGGKCANCGASLAKAKPVEKALRVVCKSCDTNVAPKHAFCPNCGETNPGHAEARKMIHDALVKGTKVDDHGADGGDVKGGDDTKPADTVDAGDNDDSQEGTGENSDSTENDSVTDEEEDTPSKPAKKTAKAQRKQAKVKVKKGKPTPGDTPGKDVTPTQPVPAHREPDGAAVEAFERDAELPTDADRDPGVGVGGPDGVGAGKGVDPEVGVTLRLRSLGVPTAIGKLHDLTCPCYHPTTVAKAWPHASLADLDEEYWSQKALDLAASAPLAEAGRAQLIWQSATTLKTARPEDLAEIQLELHKAFADANPGPGTAPSPSELSPQRFKRPYLSAGHAAPSPGQAGPNTAPITAGHVTADQFGRGFLAAGHAADSPANKASRAFYTNGSRDQARQAMVTMHDHIAATFPDLCPAQTAPAAARPPTRPTPRGLAAPAGTPTPRMAGKATANRLVEKLVKRLEKAVLKGDMSLEEAQAKLAEVTQGSPANVAEKAAEAAPEVIKAVTSGLDAATVEALVTKAVGAAVEARDTAHSEQLTRLEKTLKRQAKLIDQLADQPGSNGPYRGLPILEPPKTSPAAPVQKSSAERSRDALTQLLFEEWRNNSNPTQREAAWAEISKMMQ
jgi:polyhydroxyalkanoate synthesis regulator phasin